MKAFPRRLRDYLDSRFEYVRFLREPELGPAAAEEPGEGLLELGVYLIKGRLELLPRGPVDPLNRGVQALYGFRKVRLLVEQELVPVFKLVKFFEGREAYLAERRYLLAKVIPPGFEVLDIRRCLAFGRPVLLYKRRVLVAHPVIQVGYCKLHLSYLDGELALHFLKLRVPVLYLLEFVLGGPYLRIERFEGLCLYGLFFLYSVDLTDKPLQGLLYPGELLLLFRHLFAPLFDVGMAALNPPAALFDRALLFNKFPFERFEAGARAGELHARFCHDNRDGLSFRGQA